MATIETLSDVVKRMKPGEHIAFSIWTREVVRGAAGEMQIKVSDEQADEILDKIHNQYEDEWGVWSFIKEELTKLTTIKSGYRECDTGHSRDFPDCFEECDNDKCTWKPPQTTKEGKENGLRPSGDQ